MPSDIVLGVDPGAHGALAFLDRDGQLLELRDMPNTPEANGRYATNAPLLAEILARSHASIIYCEFVGARPTDGVKAAFAFGRARGVIEGCAGALNIPIVFITPPQWKNFAGVPTAGKTAHDKYVNKHVARTRAIAKWPKFATMFERVVDVDRAEACLIGLAGMSIEMTAVSAPQRKQVRASKPNSVRPQLVKRRPSTKQADLLDLAENS